MKLIVLSLSMVATLAGCARTGGTPGEAVQEFTRRLDAGECAGINAFIAKSEGAGAAGATDLGERITRVCTLGVEGRKSMSVAEQDQERLKLANVLDAREEEDRAIVKIEFETRAGEKQPAQLIALVRQEERWRIDLDKTRLLSSVPADTIPSPSEPAPMPMAPPMMGPPTMGPPPGPGPQPGPDSAPPPASPPSQPAPAPR